MPANDAEAAAASAGYGIVAFAAVSFHVERGPSVDHVYPPAALRRVSCSGSGGVTVFCRRYNNGTSRATLQAVGRLAPRSLALCRSHVVRQLAHATRPCSPDAALP